MSASREGARDGDAAVPTPARRAGPRPTPGPGGDARSSAIRFGLLLGLVACYAFGTGEALRTVGLMLGAAGGFTAVLGALSRTPFGLRNFTYWDEAMLLVALCAAALLADRLAPGLRL